MSVRRPEKFLNKQKLDEISMNYQTMINSDIKNVETRENNPFIKTGLDFSTLWIKEDTPKNAYSLNRIKDTGPVYKYKHSFKTVDSLINGDFLLTELFDTKNKVRLIDTNIITTTDIDRQTRSGDSLIKTYRTKDELLINKFNGTNYLIAATESSFYLPSDMPRRSEQLLTTRQSDVDPYLIKYDSGFFIIPKKYEKCS